MSDQPNAEERLREFHSKYDSMFAKISKIEQMKLNTIPIAVSLPVLMEFLMDDDGAVFGAALIALSTKGAAVVPELLRCIRSDSEDLAFRAFMVLIKMGVHAQSAIPDLIGMLDNQKWLGNSLAILGAIGDPVKPYLPLLEDMLAREERIQVMVAPVLLRIDARNKKAEDIFSRLAQSQDIDSRRVIAHSFSLHGNLSGEMSHILNELLNDSKMEVREAAAFSSLRLSTNIGKAVEVVMEIFDSGTPETQEDVVISLRVMGKLAIPTLDALKKRLHMAKGPIADTLHFAVNELETVASAP